MNDLQRQPLPDSMTSTSEPAQPLLTESADHAELYDINKAVAKKYHQQLLEVLTDNDHPVSRYLESRQIDQSLVTSWQLGYAPDDWRFLTGPLIEKGAFKRAVDAGVCIEKEARNYDFFHNRLLIPLRDERHRIVGFTGRSLDGNEPKYLNTRQTDVFSKSRVLFGIDKAYRSIARTKTAILTEGNFDVISLHRFGIDNALGKGGTALTAEQITQLKAICEQVTLIYDVDENGAGQQALLRDCEALLETGLRVQVFLLAQPGEQPPAKIDADSWVRTCMASEQPPRFSLAKHIATQAQDGLLWLAAQLTSGQDLPGQVDGEKRSVALLAKVNDEVYLKKYAKKLSVLFESEAKGLLQQVEHIRKQANKPASTEPDDEEEPGPFRAVQYRANGSIWIYGNKNWVCVAEDFQIFVKYFTEDEYEEKTWILQIQRRGFSEPLYIEVTHEEFCSASKLKNRLAGFRLAFKITDTYLGELWQHLFSMQFPTAIKVTRLGFHADSGVYFFANKAVNGQLLDPDEFGIVAYTGADNQPMYLSMPQQHKKKLSSFFRYTDSAVRFNTWFGHMSRVHKYENAFIPACFYLMALYRDVVVKHTNTCPMLYLKGGASSGKSSIVRSLCQLFGYKDPSANLKSRVLEAALIRKMSQLSNALIWLEEMTNEFDHPGVLQASYDNTGYSRSSDATSIETNSVDIYSAIAITSNYLLNDEILFTRCVFIPITEQKKTEQQAIDYKKLNDLQADGLASVTVDMLQHRALIEAQFPLAYDNLYKQLKYEVRHEENMVERLLSNMAQVLTVGYILHVHGKIELMEHTDEEDILAEFVAIGSRVIIRQHQIAAEKSYLSEFFEIIQNQYEQGYLHEGIHYRFEGDSIHLRFPSLYFLYLQRYKQAFYKPGADRETLKNDMATFEGANPDTFFRNIRFMPAENEDEIGKSRPVSNCCTMSYQKLQDAFGLDLELRRNVQN